VTYQRKNGKTEHGVKMNQDFVAEVQKMAGPTDILLVTCRSGDRSAMAVNQLAAAGFKNATARNSCWCDARPEGSADGIYLAERQAGSWRKG
jgi:rhodanese-related sulfurtransferase